MKQTDCPKCQASWLIADDEAPVCPSCGYGRLSAMKSPGHTISYAQSRLRHGLRTPDPNLAIAGVVINALLFPGLGTISAGRRRPGYWQVGTFLAGIVLTFVVIGVFIIVGVWLWALATGIEMVGEAKRRSVMAPWSSLLIVLLAGCVAGPYGAEGHDAQDQLDAIEEPLADIVDGCTPATWQDPALFAMALERDLGNLSRHHDVEPGLHYVAPRHGLSIPNGTGLPFPHNISYISVGSFDDSISVSSGMEPQLRVIARDEDEARRRARDFLHETSLSDPATIDRWLESLELAGHADGVPAFRATLGGDFRWPEALNGVEASQSSLRSASIRGPDWRASVDLPIYRVSPGAGFIELSPLGEVYADLVPQPTLREAADAALARHGIGPSTFHDLFEFYGFGRTSCGERTLT